METVPKLEDSMPTRMWWGPRTQEGRGERRDLKKTAGLDAGDECTVLLLGEFPAKKEDSIHLHETRQMGQ